MMSVYKSFKVFTLYAIAFCACQSCTSIGKETTDFIEPNAVVIDKNFKSEKLNDKLVFCRNLKKTDLNNKNLRAYLLKNAEPTNHKRSMIMVGDYHKHPDAWFYTQIINTDDFAHELVVDEDNHIRCDGLEVITFKGDSLKNWGSVLRSTPFSERQIPFYPYAIPISVNSKDTLNLLIHTQKIYGFQEVNLNIARYQTFLDKTLNQFLFQSVEIIILTLCLLVMYIIGWIFTDKTMLYLGIYLTCGLLSLLSFPGYLDTVILHPNIGLTASGFTPFAVFLLNAFYHPYGMELMKPVPKNEKRFKILSYSIFGVNILVICTYFLPLNLFHKIDIYLPPLMGILAVLSVLWLFYSSLLAYFRANIKYFFIAVCVAFLPFLYEQFSNVFFDAQHPLTLKVSQSSFVLSVIGVSIISIFQLREKVVSRKNYEQNLTQLKETMEGIRKSEVETIGRNLHDQVGNTLASALGYLNLKTMKVDLVQKLIMDAINEIRFLSHNLVKDEDKPLTEKLEALVSRFNDFSTINFQYSDFSNAKINSLEPLNQQNIYMIVQEIMTNIIKHSKATEAYIQIFENEKNIAINIEDDGIGMANLNENKGIGLQNIQKRVEVSNLKITTDSTPNGTNFIIEIPYGNSNSNH